MQVFVEISKKFKFLPILGGALFRFLLSKIKRIPRILVVLLGMVIHLAVFTLVFLNLPNDSPLNKTNEHGVFSEPRFV